MLILPGRHTPTKGPDSMKRFMIERDIPGIGEMSVTELCGAARASNQALASIGPSITVAIW